MFEKVLKAKSYAPVAGTNHKAAKRTAPVALFIALALCVVLCVLELFFVFFQVIISTADEFDNDRHVAYTTLISVLATMLALFITTQIRNGWVRWVDYRLVTENRAALRNIDMSWRANMGFLTLKERVTKIHTWPIQLLYLVTGLLAAGFISAMTPTTGAAMTSYSPWIPKGADSSCAGSFAKKPGKDDPAGWATGEATWSISDSMNYAASNRTDSFRCPLSQMPGLMNLINNEAPQKMAYSIDGTAVQGSALGTPEILFSAFYNTNLTTAYRDALSSKGSNLLSLTQCAPVLKKNPFKCRADPQGTTKIDIVGSSNFGTFSVSSGGCTYSYWYNGNLDNGTSSQLLSGQFCAGSTVGQGTMVLGGYSNAAVNLALMVGDLDWANANWQQAKGYTVRCDVDVPGALGWREVTLNLQNRMSSDSPFGQVLTGGNDCTPPSGDNNALGLAYAATAAAVAGKVLTDENEEVYFPKTLIGRALNQTGNHPAMYKADPIQPQASMMRTAPWAFGDGSSINGLEDTLGVAAGIVMSKMIAQNFTGNEDIGTVDTSTDPKTHAYVSKSGDAILPAINLTGSFAVEVIRVGPGQTWAVIYAVPALISALVCVALVVKVPWHRETLTSASLLDVMAMANPGQIQMDRTGGVAMVVGATAAGDGFEPSRERSPESFGLGRKSSNGIMDHNVHTSYKEEHHDDVSDDDADIAGRLGRTDYAVRK